MISQEGRMMLIVKIDLRKEIMQQLDEQMKEMQGYI